jgi:glycosyltransferase involved in cell wall biosynthesis
MNATRTRGKIAIVASSAPPIVSGGISSAHYNLLIALKRKGFDARLFTYADHTSAPLSEKDVIRHGTPLCILKLLNYFVRIYKYVLSWREGCLYSYQFPYIVESALGAWKINRSLQTFKPDVLIVPDNGAPDCFIKKIEGCQTIFISHHNALRFIDEVLFGKFSRIDANLASSIERKTLIKVDKVICPSHYMLDMFKRTHHFTGPLAVIPNLVDSNLIESIPIRDIRSSLSLPNEAPLVYIPSGGSQLKGSRFIFEIVRRIALSWGQEIGFYLSGSIADELMKRELDFVPKNAKVYRPGYVGYYENISIIKGCSFCVSPTLIESFGMAILEANFCGLPVVAFAVGGNVDIISEGVNGLLAPFMDTERLLSLSIQLLNQNRREEMSSRTLLLVKDKFNGYKIADQYIEFILS